MFPSLIGFPILAWRRDLLCATIHGPYAASAPPVVAFPTRFVFSLEALYDVLTGCGSFSFGYVGQALLL
ncbi:hypothetical protein Scep_006948 [Stephania cephalantha]|uniref:Uncharacterized protein n=1 Tax=Stephania cephalantha TaxID=152367 RepID=A0AAP0K8X8_9MAGN